MASNLITAACVMLGVLFVCQFLQDAQCLRMDINQPRYTEESAGPVQISCQPDMADSHEQKDVSVLEIGKEDQRPMAYVSRKSGISYGTAIPTSYQAYGVIGDNGGKTALTVTIPNPTNGDNGAYVCRMHYFDTSGAFLEESVFANLTVKIVDTPVVVKTLLKTIDDLQEQMKDLASKVSDETKALWDKSQALDERTENHTRMMNHLAERSSYNLAFSASFTGPTSAWSGDDMIFGNVITRIGKGYDETTGIFTAPRDGTFVFHLVMKTYDSCCYTTIYLKANDKVIASLFVEVTTKHDDIQSSVSSVVQLEQGDRVKAVATGSMKWRTGTNSVFSGYLIHV